MVENIIHDYNLLATSEKIFPFRGINLDYPLKYLYSGAKELENMENLQTSTDFKNSYFYMFLIPPGTFMDSNFRLRKK